MAASKLERLAEIMRRLEAASPFASGTEVRAALEGIMRAVEDELSGIPENPNADIAPADGRMYPPHDRFEYSSGSPGVRAFRMRRHRTLIGDNGALKIVAADGKVEIDLPGSDRRSLDDLLAKGKS